MNEEKIKELLNVLFSTTVTKTYTSSRDTYTVKVIDEQHRLLVEQIIRGFLIDNKDSKIGEL